MMLRVFLLIGIVLLSSCGIGGFWMNGNPHMEPTQPYGAHWIKDGMTKDSRRFDFVECGGGIDLGDGYEVQSNQSKSTQEIFDGLNTHVHRVLTCMKSKSYEYLPKCDARCLYP